MPYAFLNTDDRDGYGPEVITVSRVLEGTYRYSIRRFTGTRSTIETSGAVLNVVIPDIGIYTFTPPIGQPSGTNIWRVFDMVVDPNGNIQVHPINDYVEGGDNSDLLFP